MILEEGRVRESGAREHLVRDPDSRFSQLLQAALNRDSSFFSKRMPPITPAPAPAAYWAPQTEETSPKRVVIMVVRRIETSTAFISNSSPRVRFLA
jgi:hypothetical protein